MIRKIPFFSFPTHKRNHARSTKKTTKITRKWSVSSAQGSKNYLISKYKLITFLRLELLQDTVACQTWTVRVSKIKLMRWEGGLKETVWVLVKKCRSVISDLNLRFFIIESQSRYFLQIFRGTSRAGTKFREVPIWLSDEDKNWRAVSGL